MAYVYAYIIDGKFRYIGKGTDDRDISHLKCISNKDSNINPWHNYLRKQLKEGIEPKIVRLLNDVSDEKAYGCEIGLIKIIGKVIDKTGTLLNTYNGGEGTHKGFKRSPEIIEKIRQANLGKKRSKEFCINNSLWQTGRKHTPERIEKNRQSQIGNTNALGAVRTNEFKEKLRQINLGNTQSAKTIAKRVLLTTGKKRTPEQKERMSHAAIKRWTPEQKKIQSDSMKGYKHSEETKAKMRKPKSKKHIENIRQATLNYYERKTRWLIEVI